MQNQHTKTVDLVWFEDIVSPKVNTTVTGDLAAHTMEQILNREKGLRETTTGKTNF
jgi:hypothetical protein